MDQSPPEDHFHGDGPLALSAANDKTGVVRAKWPPPKEIYHYTSKLGRASDLNSEVDG